MALKEGIVSILTRYRFCSCIEGDMDNIFDGEVDSAANEIVELVRDKVR